MENALFDAPGRGHNAEITDDEKAWIINIACQKPINFGYAAETWTYARLTSHINKNAEAAEIKPFRIRYYCENRDPDFDSKMHTVLLVYKQLSMKVAISFHGRKTKKVVHVLSYDEKPGIQAIATTSEDLLPNEHHGTVNRDYEYKNLKQSWRITSICILMKSAQTQWYSTGNTTSMISMHQRKLL